MRHRRLDAARFGVIALLAITSSRVVGDEPLRPFTFERPKMGTIVRVTVYSRDVGLANDAARAAYARASDLNAVLSDYEPGSEINRLCRDSGPGRPVVVSEPLFTVLNASVRLSKQSDGAFDVTVGPVTKLWRKARRQRKLPEEDEVAAATALVGWRNVVLDSKARTVELKKSGMRLDLGGIAKGYVADAMLEVLKEEGCPSAMIDAGGDLVLGDPPPGRKGWRIVIASLDRSAASSKQPGVSSAGNPRILEVANCGVATSGDLYQFLEIDGVRYSHIVDPQTGLGLVERTNVTVVAGNGMLADAHASAISVLGPARGLVFASRSKGVETFVRFLDDDVVRSRATCGFPADARPVRGTEATPE